MTAPEQANTERSRAVQAGSRNVGVLGFTGVLGSLGKFAETSVEAGVAVLSCA